MFSLINGVIPASYITFMKASVHFIAHSIAALLLKCHYGQQVLRSVYNMKLVCMQLLLLVASYGEQYKLHSEMGIRARIDLLNALKFVFMLAKRRATQKEVQAAQAFAKFLNTSDSDEYLEGFYNGPYNNDRPNDMLTFLRAYSYNGDSSKEAWVAVHVIMRMFRSPRDLDRVEMMRAKFQQRGIHRSQRVLIVPKEVDFVKLFNNPKIYYATGDVSLLETTGRKETFSQLLPAHLQNPDYVLQ